MPKAGVKPRPVPQAATKAAALPLFEMPDMVRQDREAKKEWDRIVPAVIEAGLALKVDTAALAGYCLCWSRIVTAEADIRKHGLVMTTKDGPRPRPEVKIARDNWTQLRYFAEEFGFTPAGRARIEPDGLRQPLTAPQTDASDQAAAAKRFFGF